MSTINDSDLLLVERNGNLHQITYDQMSTLNDDDILLVERGGVQYKVEAQYVSTGANGLIIPPVEVLTPINGAGITEFDQYEPLSSAITAVGEAGTIAKDTDEIQSVADGSAWNQSQTWSSQVTGSFYASGYDQTEIFDGSLTTQAQSTGATWTTNVPFTTLRIYGKIFGAGSRSISVNGVDVTSQMGANGAAPQWHTITGVTSPITSIQWNGGGYSGAAPDLISIHGIEVDGKLLVDTGIAGAPLSGKILSFPTNTNFSGLSVGDVAQAGLELNGTASVTQGYTFTDGRGNLDNLFNGVVTGNGTSGADYNANLVQPNDAGGLPCTLTFDPPLSARSGTLKAYVTRYSAGTVNYTINGSVGHSVYAASSPVEDDTGVTSISTFTFDSTTGNAQLWGFSDGEGVLQHVDNVNITAIDASAPSVTVDGGDWDASNQSQVWSSQAIGGSLGSVDIAFNGEVPSLGSSPSGGNYSAPMTFEPTAFSTPGSVNSLVIYGARNAGSPRYIKVDGVIVPFTDNNTFQELTVNVTSFSSIVCEHNGTDGSVIAAIYVNGKLLVDAVEDSQVWTNSSSFTTGTLQAGQLSYAFDGDTSTVLESGVGGVWEVNFSTPLSGEVVVWNTQAAASRKWHVYVDGVDNAFDITPAVGYQTLGTFTNITKITQTSDHNGAGWGTSVAAIKIGGKLLIDAGIRDFGDRYLGSSISYEKSLTFSDTTELANMVTPLEMVDANGDVVTPVSDTIANVSGNVLTLQGDTNLAYFQPGDEVQTGVEIVSVDAAAPSITVDGGSWYGADGSGSTYEISKSLRFDDSDQSNLNRTPSTASNRKKITWSGWTKRSELGGTQRLMFVGPGSNYFSISFNNDQIQVEESGGSNSFYVYTNALFRDPSAWYHVVVSIDTAQATQTNRVKVYVNGVDQALTAGNNWPPQNANLQINNTVDHRIGRNDADCFNGYLAEVHFVDGQALAPTAFGDFGANNVWQAKAASISSYGTNGFHLDFSDSSSDAALGYDAAGSNNWTVNNLTAAGSGWNQSQTWSSGLTGPDYPGYSITNAFDSNTSTVAYAPIGYTSTVILPGGPITLDTASSLRVWVSKAGAASSFFINGVDYTSQIGLAVQWYTITGETQVTSIGFANIDGSQYTGLYAVEVNGLILVNSGILDPQAVNTDSLVDTPTNYTVDSGNPGGNYATMNPLDTESLTLSNGNLDITNFNNSRRTHSTIFQSSGKWYAEFTITAAPNDVQIGISNKDGTSYLGSDLNSWGVISIHGNHIHNASQSSYGSSFTTGDTIMVALDMDNGKWYAGKNGTWFNSGNPANGTNPAYTGLSGNICFAVGSNSWNGAVSCNFGARSFRYTPPTDFLSLCTTNLPEPIIKDGSKHFGIVTYTGNNSAQTFNTLGFSPDLVWAKARNQSLTSHQWFDTVRGVNKAIYSDFVGAEETVANTLTSFNSDGFTMGTGNSLGVSGRTYVAWCWNAGDTTETIAVGGLNSSIYDDSQVWSNWSAETGSLYLDGRRVSAFNNDFTNIGPGSQTHVIQWNGSIAWTNEIEIIVANQASVSQSGNKGPWFFEFTHAGGTLTVNSSNWTGHNSTDAEISAGTIPFYDFTSQLVSPLTRIRIHGGAGSHQAIGIGAIKTDGRLLVDYGVSVDAVPSIASEVRANPEAGFSIVSYTANNTNSFVGHGLNAAPGMVIVKNRDQSFQWTVYHDSLDADKCLFLNSTSAATAGSAGPQFNNSKTTSTTFPIGAGGNTNYPSGSNLIAYCFAPVEGYSAMGSYTGNGSTDGPFVFTGFRISFLLYKRTDVGSNWYIMDTERDPDNPTTQRLLAESSNAEYTYSSTDLLDVNANGFKVRSSNNAINANGGTYIYYAVAENPLNMPLEVDASGDTQVALDALVAAATEIVETDGTTMYLNGATGPWRTGLSIEGSQINDDPPGPSEITFTSQNQGTPAFSGVDATLASRTWTLESGTTATGPWTLVDTYSDFGVLNTQTGATPWTENKPTLQPNTYYRIKVQYNSTNADSVESVYNTFKTGDA